MLLYVAGLSHAHTPTHTHIPAGTHLTFLPPHRSPQERQSIIKYWMDNLRAKHGEVLHNINFLEGQPISELHPLFSHCSANGDLSYNWNSFYSCLNVPAVPELSARGVIQQVFPLHEQRILGQLMKSWVQAVCEKQPLG